jgi:hypothetical protein
MLKKVIEVVKKFREFREGLDYNRKLVGKDKFGN